MSEKENSNLKVEYINNTVSNTRDPLIWVLPLLLSGIGIIMIVSITSPWTMENTGSAFSRGIRQLQGLGLGLISMVIFSIIPTNFLKKSAGIFWVIAVGAAFLTLFPGVGVKVGGARRWIDLGFIRFQPLEILTLAVVIELAKSLAGSEKQGLSAFFCITAVILCVSVLPLILQPNMGGTILIFGLCMAIHVELKGWRIPLLLGSTFFPLFLWFILQGGYRLRRYIAFIDPWKDPLSSGFQVIQGLVAFANGGISGVGIGNGLQKMNFLPAAHTDYILATLGEEFGLIGTMTVLCLFILWTSRIYMLYAKATEPFQAALIWGIALSDLFPFFINVGGVLKMIPLTGIPLPFMSFGSSAMIVMWMKIGILLRIYREIRFSGAMQA